MISTKTEACILIALDEWQHNNRVEDMITDEQIYDLLVRLASIYGNKSYMKTTAAVRDDWKRIKGLK